MIAMKKHLQCIGRFYKKEYLWEFEVDSNLHNFERFKTLVKELTEDVVERYNYIQSLEIQMICYNQF